MRLIEGIQEKSIDPVKVIQEMIATICAERDSQQEALATQLKSLAASRGASETGPSIDSLATAIEFMLRTPHSSRVPVLLLQSAWLSVRELTKVTVSDLSHHNAADTQTGSTGDIFVTFTSENYAIAYEVKDRAVTAADLDIALRKVASLPDLPIGEYVFFGTSPDGVSDSLKAIFEASFATSGIDFVYLSCVDFVRYFLSIFHMQRDRFVDEFRALVSSESESALSGRTKVAVLALLQNALR